MSITNSTLANNVKIQIIPYMNDAFFRIYLYATALYQDNAYLIARVTIKTLYTYNSNSKFMTADFPL